MTEVFEIWPASAKPLWFVGVIGALLTAVLVVLAWTAWSSRHSRVEVTADHVRLRGDLWGRTIPLRSLDVAGARVLDLQHASEYQPRRRTFGTGMPGYASGWFRLRNGEKALVYLTHWRRVAYVPTSEGYSLLLSVREPERLVEALGRRG